MALHQSGTKTIALALTLFAVLALPATADTEDERVDTVDYVNTYNGGLVVVGFSCFEELVLPAFGAACSFARPGETDVAAMIADEYNGGAVSFRWALWIQEAGSAGVTTIHGVVCGGSGLTFPALPENHVLVGAALQFFPVINAVPDIEYTTWYAQCPPASPLATKGTVTFTWT